MGMDFFAVGNFLLGSAYVLQLLEGGPAWSAMNVLNHTLPQALPVAYWLGAMRFFGQPVPLLRPIAPFRYWCSGAWGLWPATPCSRAWRRCCFLSWRSR